MFQLREDVNIISVVKDLPFNPLKHHHKGWKLRLFSAAKTKQKLNISSPLRNLKLLDIYGHQMVYETQLKQTGPRSAVGNVSGYRCVSDCNSRGREFDPGPVPYFLGDWSWNYFYGHSPPFRWSIQEGLLSVTSESMCANYWLTACSSLPRKKVWLGELTVPQWP